MVWEVVKRRVRRNFICRGEKEMEERMSVGGRNSHRAHCHAWGPELSWAVGCTATMLGAEKAQSMAYKQFW